MSRDARKNTDYFNKYLEYQNKRIQQFQEKVSALNDDSQTRKLNIYLSSFLRDKFYASYSNGVGIDELKSIYMDWLSAIEKSNTVLYSDLIDLTSLFILLEPNKNDVVRITQLIKNSKDKDDLLIMFLNEWLTDRKTKIFTGEIKYDEYKNLSDAITETVNINKSSHLIRFISKDWYTANNKSSWYDSHKNDKETYVGYWCFIGAALAKIFLISKENFDGVDYFPTDLL